MSDLIFDQTPREKALGEQADFLIREGSRILVRWHGWEKVIEVPIDRILALSFALSKSDIGLQVADFFASVTGCVFRAVMDPDFQARLEDWQTWWSVLEIQLYGAQEAAVPLWGGGLKVFPEILKRDVKDKKTKRPRWL